jgi:MFS family permease
MVNVAFPAMAAAFAVPPEHMRWVIVCYVLWYALLSFAGGALGDAVGHARVLRAGLAGSAIAFAAAAVAPTFGWFLAARALQGVSAGLVYGTAPALVTAGLPDTARVRALGFLNASIGVASTIAPAVAGWLVDHFGWRAIFHVRAPLAAAVLVWALLRAGAPPERGAVPRLTLGDFARGGVVAPGVLAFLANAAIFAIWLLAPFYLVQRRGLDTTSAGLLFMLTPAGMTAGAAIAARLPGSWSGRPAVVGGLVLQGAALLALGGAGPHTPVPLLGLSMFATGLGLGVFQTPNMAALMREFPAGRQGAAGGFAFLARTLGVVAGVLGLAHLFGSARARDGFDAGFLQAFTAGASAVAAAAVIGLLANRRRAR